MYRVAQSADSLTITEFRWIWAMLCALFMITTAVGAWQAHRASELDLFKTAAVLVILGGLCFGVVLFSTHTTYEVSATKRKVTWNRVKLGRQTGGALSFGDIDSVGLESQRRKTMTLTRVVIYSERGDLPLSSMHSGRFEENKKLAESVRRLVFRNDTAPEDDLIIQSVREMVKRGQTLQATGLLTGEVGMSLKEARRRIKDIAEELNGSTGRAD